VTEVCLLASEDLDLQMELLGSETARGALSQYQLRKPYENTLVIETISLGMAISLLNDLNWYLVRFTDAAFVREPSVSDTEWLSRSLAEAVRDGTVEPAETTDRLQILGIEENRLVEPMYVTRSGGPESEHPDYDLRDVEETMVVRVHPEEL